MITKFVLYSLVLTQLAFYVTCKFSEELNDISSKEVDDDYEDSVESHKKEDKRQFRAITLPNGLKLLLVSNKGKSEANMALDINVGYMNSPKNAPYMADLFAHTFLMAIWPNIKQETRKYKYFRTNDGFVSSTTSADRTVFDFRNMPNVRLSDILKRLADQLTSPQISLDLLDRGLWEYNQDVNFDYRWDAWRFSTWLRSLAEPDHQYFADNLITDQPNVIKNENLNRMAMLKDMHKFFGLHYSANLMTLVLVCNQTMDELMNLTMPLFSQVPNKNLPMPVWLKHPYSQSETGKIFHMELYDNYYKNWLFLLFPITDYASSPFATEPWSYLTFVLTKKGQRSLPVVLKQKNLAKKFEAYVEKVAEGVGFFKIVCRLTKKGHENVPEVVKLITEYINYVKTVPAQGWIHDEIQIELESKFEALKQTTTYSDELLSNLRNVPTQYLTNENYVMDEFQPKMIEKVLSQIRPDNMNVYVWTESVAGVSGKVGKFFDKKYTMEKMNSTFFYQLNSTNANASIDFTLPYPIRNSHDSPATSRAIAKRRANLLAKIVLKPKLIAESDSHRIWYLKNDLPVFQSQKVVLHFKLMNSLKHQSLANYVASDEHGRTLVKVLKSTFRRMKNVDYLTVHLSTLYSGYSLWFTGKPDKLYPFVAKIFENLASPDRVKKQITIRNGRSDYTGSDGKSSVYSEFMKSSLKWTNEQIWANEENITSEQIVEFHRNFFSKLYIEMFSYGNISEQETVKVYNDVVNVTRKISNTKPMSLAEIQKPKIVVLPEGKEYVFRTTRPPGRYAHESAVRILYQLGPFESLEKMAVSKVASCIVQDLIYRKNLPMKQKQLENSTKFPDTAPKRLKKVYLSMNRDFLEFSARSSKLLSFTPHQLDSAIDDRINIIEQKLLKMNEPKFRQFKKGCGSHRFDDFYDSPMWRGSIDDIIDLHRQQIENGDYTFNKTSIFKQALKKVSKEDVISFYKEVFSASSPKRRKFAIHVQGFSTQKDLTDKKLPEKVNNVIYVTDISAFKASLDSYVFPEKIFELISLPDQNDQFWSSEVDDDDD